jgi:hypothetical protein
VSQDRVDLNTSNKASHAEVIIAGLLKDSEESLLLLFKEELNYEIFFKLGLDLI